MEPQCRWVDMNNAIRVDVRQLKGAEDIFRGIVTCNHKAVWRQFNAEGSQESSQDECAEEGRGGDGANDGKRDHFLPFYSRTKDPQNQEQRK